MKNPYSLALLALLLCFAFFMVLATTANELGTAITLAILTTIMASGFKILSPSPRTVGIITFLGEKTEYKVEGVTLLFHPLGLDIVNVVPIIMVLKEKTYPFKNITCLNGLIDAELTLGMLPDDQSGTTLSTHDNAGGTEEIFGLLDDISRSALQSFARDKTTQEMITNASDYMVPIFRIITGMNEDDLRQTDDARYFGSKFPKAILKCTDNAIVAEERQRVAAAGLMKLKITDRIRLFEEVNADRVSKGQDPEPIPSFQALREMILEEERHEQGNAQEIRSGTGGRVITVNETNRRSNR